jgi:hypothetical protein
VERKDPLLVMKSAAASFIKNYFVTGQYKGTNSLMQIHGLSVV